MPLKIYFSVRQKRFMLRGEGYDINDKLEDEAIELSDQIQVFLPTVGRFPVPIKSEILAIIKDNRGFKFDLGPEENIKSDEPTVCRVRPLLNQRKEMACMALLFFPYSQDPLNGAIIRWPLKLVVQEPEADHPAFKKIGPTHYYHPS